MKKSFTTTLVLAGVFVVLIGWLAIYEKHVKPSQTEAEEKGKTIVTLPAKEIQEMEIVRMKNAPPEGDAHATQPANPEYETIRLRKAGEDWNLIAPIQDVADSTTVNPNVNSLTTTKYERIVDEAPKDLEPFGLKTPLIKVTIKKTSSDPGETIWIGHNTPTGFSSYVKIGNRPAVYRVSRSLRTSFDKDVKALRKKTIFSVSRDDISEIEVQNQIEDFVLTKDDKEKGHEEWFLAREHIPADSTEVNKLLNSIIDLRAIEFAAENTDNLAAFGLNKPVARVWFVKAKDKSKTGIAIGKVKNKLYVRREDKPIVYEVAADSVKNVGRPASEYRSMHLANFNRFDIKRVKLERGKTILEFLKDDKGWMMPTDPKIKVDAAKVDSLLSNLQDAKITKYLTGNSKSETSSLTIRLFEKKDNAEKERLALMFSSPQGQQILTEQSDLDIPFLIPKDEFKKLDLAQRDFETVEKKEEKKAVKKPNS